MKIFLGILIAIAEIVVAQPKMIYIRAGLAKETQLAEYTQAAEELGIETIHFHIPMNPFTANHRRDWRRLLELVDQQAGDGPVFAFGYSIGGKFAARLVRDSERIAAAFLLDPVDGGPPILPKLWPHLPIFMDSNHPLIAKPTWIISTEFGGKRGIFGLRCVTKNQGARHFASHVTLDSLEERHILGSGHLELILPVNLDKGHGEQCPFGGRDHASIRAESVSYWEEFLGQLAL